VTAVLAGWRPRRIPLTGWITLLAVLLGLGTAAMAVLSVLSGQPLDTAAAAPYRRENGGWYRP